MRWQKWWLEVIVICPRFACDLCLKIMCDWETLLNFMCLSVLHFRGKGCWFNEADWLLFVSKLYTVLGAFLDGLHFTSMLQFLLWKLLLAAEICVAKEKWLSQRCRRWLIDRVRSKINVRANTAMRSDNSNTTTLNSMIAALDTKSSFCIALFDWPLIWAWLFCNISSIINSRSCSAFRPILFSLNPKLIWFHWFLPI